MLRVLLFAVIVTLFIIIRGRYKKMDPAQQRKMLWQMGTGILLCGLLLLVVTGKIHWIGAALGALLPFMRSAYGLLSQVLPLWLARKKAPQDTHAQEPSKPASMPMAIQEALDVLGLSGDITKGDISENMIHDSHRRLIQKLHPDRGGNNYLAAKINQARDLLLEKIKH